MLKTRQARTATALADLPLQAVAPERENGKLPLVSVVLPVRNESHFIEDSLAAIFAQDYPAELTEIIVADGMSNDGTREIIERLQGSHPNLRLIDNPKRIVTTGVNAAIAASKGEVIVWLGGHCAVAPDFVSQSVKMLEEHPDAWSVGGPVVSTGRSPLGKAVAAAMSHRLGVGNATHRFPDYEGYGEGAPFPVVRRWVFDRVGNYDEKLVRNQDDEFNYRMALAGGKVYLTPRISATYYVRESLALLWRQYFQYSFWRIPVIRKHQRPTTLRQMAPLLFYITVIALGAIGLWRRQPLIALGLPAVYTSALLLAGASLTPKLGFAVACRVPAAIATMHAAYATGLTYGIWASVFRPDAWDYDSHMAEISR